MAKRQPLNNKRFFLLGLTLFLFCCSPNVNAKVFNAETFTLENGLQVIVIPNHRAPVVTHMVWYRVGAADEPQGLSGMAHYFEHLMFKGTETSEPGEFSRLVKKLGGNDNAFTGQDYTAYFQSISVDHLEKMMEMESDRMMNLSVPDEHFASEKQVVLEERRQRVDNDPKGVFNEQMKSSLFVNHPYGTPVIGWMDEIKGYEWEDVKVFYDQWYAPNNAIVVISGDVTIKSVKPMVERTYGQLKPKKLPTKTRTEIPPGNSETLMVLSHESINQPAFRSMRLAPAYHKNKDDSLALMVLEEILSGGPTTRLYKHLVVDQKKAISVGFSYNGSSLDYGNIYISGVPSEGVSLTQLQNFVEDEVMDVIENGVTDKEVEEAIQRMQDAAIYARDSLSGPAMTFGYGLTTGASIDDIENWPTLIGKVTAEDVKRVAEKYAAPDDYWIRPPVVGHLLPIGVTDSDLEQAQPEQSASEGENQ